MSDTTAAETATEATTGTLTPEAAPAQETDWKAEARKWEARAKENTEAAKRLSEIEEANKTEAQKAAERLTALERENEALKTSSLRAEVAAAKGVPLALLTGASREELEAQAEALIAYRGEKKPAVDPALGREAAPSGNNGTGDWLRDQIASKN